MSDRVLDAPVVMPRALVAPMVSRRKVARVPVSDWIISNLSMIGGVVRSRRAMRCGIACVARARQLDTCDAADLDRLRETVAMKLRRDAKSHAHQIEALAIASQNASRHLGMTPFCQQLAAASALLRGEAAEMDTGEGKTLMAFLAASVYALGGRHVHIVTANDYLASRDAELLRPAFAGMGQSVGVVTGSSSPQQRREAHQADVVFMSNKEAAFDYLRDRLNRVAFSGNPNLSAKLGRVLGRAAQSGHIQRALDVAIVDEIDSVLVDDAGTPLVISAPTWSVARNRFGWRPIRSIRSMRRKLMRTDVSATTIADVIRPLPLLSSRHFGEFYQFTSRHLKLTGNLAKSSL